MQTWWMVTITLTDIEGVERRLTDAAEGLSLMEVAKANDVAGIMADCGGACSCATCHVFIDPDWWNKVGPPDDIEFAMLDMVSDVAQPTSRLACQIRLSPDLDGLRVTVAPGGGF
jgi:ferredoxin, 2Fe-2S